MSTLSQGWRYFIEFFSWGLLFTLVWATAMLTFTITGAITSATYPYHYANGYCAALGGERLNDETCNVDGKVVVIQK